MAIIENITRKEYEKLKGINASRLKPYYESALNGNYEASKPRVESSAMKFGTACHAMVLEPKLFSNDYAELLPLINKRTGNPYGATTNAFLDYVAELPNDKIYLSKTEWDLLTNIDDNLSSNINAQKILGACPKRETAMTWTDAETGLKCKALVDFMGDKIVGDLKTCRDIPFRGEAERTAIALKWELVKNGNMLQFAFYLDGCLANDLNIEKFAVIFARNNGNCDTATVFLSEDSLDIGRKMYARSLVNWRDRENNTSSFAELMEV
jgi:hypothetical protein